MSVSYDNRKIIPVEFVTTSREPVERGDGGVLGDRVNIALKGRLVAHRGSPTSSGTWWTTSGYPPDEVVPEESRLGSLLRKKAALETLFGNHGRSLEVQSADGSAPMKFNPRVKRVEFDEGKWVDVLPFTVLLEADLPAEPGRPVEKFSEEWNVEFLDEKLGTYRLSRSLSAQSRQSYDETGTALFGGRPWETARDYVLGHVGLGLKPDMMAASGVLNATGLQAFNYVRAQHVGEADGLFSVTESWVCFDPLGQPPAVHDYTVTSRLSPLDNRLSVSVEGTVTGLEKRDNSTYSLITSRWVNAQDKWVNYVLPFVFSTAQTVAGITLNPTPLSSQTGLNPQAGTVNYRADYDNRPLTFTPGAVSEVVTIVNNHAADAFAQIPVLGRPFGPVLQALGTVTAKKRTVNIETQMPPASMTFTPAAPVTWPIVLLVMPVSVLGVFLESDTESWTAENGRYSRQTTFVWE